MFKEQLQQRQRSSAIQEMLNRKIKGPLNEKDDIKVKLAAQQIKGWGVKIYDLSQQEIIIGGKS